MAKKNRFNGKKGKGGGKKGRKPGHRRSTKAAKRKSAGHKLVRYNVLAAKIGKAAAHAQVYGGKKPRAGVSRSGRKPGGHKPGRKSGTHKSAKRVAAGRRLFLAQAKKHGGVEKYKNILRKRLAAYR